MERIFTRKPCGTYKVGTSHLPRQAKPLEHKVHSVGVPLEQIKVENKTPAIL
jgi:hypothetical protein